MKKTAAIHRPGWAPSCSSGNPAQGLAGTVRLGWLKSWRGRVKCGRPRESSGTASFTALWRKLCRFLMELGALFLLGENDTGLLLQSVYEKLAEEKIGCSWELYEVYKHLKSLGYIVGRHGVPWTLKSVKSNVPMVDKFITDKLNKLDLNELRLAFDVYLPNGKFRKSSPGDPSYVLCFTRESPPLRAEVEVLERQCGHIPVKLCHIENGRVSFFSFSKVDLPVLP